MLVFRRRLSAIIILFSLSAICLLLWNENIFHSSAFTYERRWKQRTPSKPAFPPIHGHCSISPENNKIPQDVNPCANFPTRRLQDVQIILKTGIAERALLATQLQTFASCISNILIVSDAEDHIAGHNVIDVLADLPASYNSYPDDDVDKNIWDAYSAQKAQLAAGETIHKSPGGWKLDRFKFLPMISQAHRTVPNAKWYVFIETDIYFFWDSLFRVLDRLDPAEWHYLGSPAPGPPNFWFAYGGAGIVLSGQLVRDLVRNGSQDLSVKYMDLVKSDPSGDAVLGYTIDQEVGARLGHMYPTFPGEDLGLRITEEKWCVPLVGLHRVNEEQMEALWAWERCGRVETDEPITYSTLLDFGVGPVILRNGPQSSHWNNGADAGKADGGVKMVSADTCAEACMNNDKCLQYSFIDKICYQADYVQLGGAVDEDVISGWNVAKLEQLGFSAQRKSAPTCRTIKWLRPKKGKPFPG